LFASSIEAPSHRAGQRPDIADQQLRALTNARIVNERTPDFTHPERRVVELSASR
jgi:hypothetical protein